MLPRLAGGLRNQIEPPPVRRRFFFADSGPSVPAPALPLKGRLDFVGFNKPPAPVKDGRRPELRAESLLCKGCAKG
jgi:hypothetical protein